MLKEVNRSSVHCPRKKVSGGSNCWSLKNGPSFIPANVKSVKCSSSRRNRVTEPSLKPYRIPSTPEESFTMRLFNAIVALMPILALAKSNIFEDYRKQSFPIKITDANFKQVTSAPRDHATVVLLTAMDNRFGCAACREFQPEWDFLSRSWQKGDKKGESRVLFTTVDFSEGRETFTSLGLQHAPVVMLYPPTTGPNAKASPDPLRFDFTG